MPTFKIDIDYGLDFFNVHATTGLNRKVTPAWKVISAPKLPPKEKAPASRGVAKPADRPKLIAARTQGQSDSKSQTNKKSLPQPSETPQQVPRAAAPKPVNGTPKQQDLPSSKDTQQKAGSKAGTKVSEAMAPAVQNAVSTAGGFAGDVVCGVGGSINGVGQSLNGAISQYGNGAKDYGNAIKDWSSASGVRTQTASNPLGLSDSSTGGRRAISGSNATKPSSTWNPAPSSGAPKSLPSAQKALPAAKNGVSSMKSTGASAKSNTASKTGASPAKSIPSSINTAKKPPNAGVSKGPSKPPAKSPASSTSTKSTAFKSPPSTAKKSSGISKSNNPANRK